MLKTADIKKMDAKAIDAKVQALKTELFTMKMQHATSGMEKPHKVSELKKDIARLLTVKKQKGE